MKKTILMVMAVLILSSCTAKKTEEAKVEETTIETTVEETTEAKILSDLDAELKDIETKSDEINHKLSVEATTQLELNDCAKELYELWDVEINSIWKRIKAKDDKTAFAKLKKEEEAWVKEKESAVAEIKKQYNGGSISPMEEYKTAADMTRERTYILARYLGKLIDEEVYVPTDLGQG